LYFSLARGAHHAEVDTQLGATLDAQPESSTAEPGEGHTPTRIIGLKLGRTAAAVQSKASELLL
jgi:hypothetical protein